VKPVLSIFCRAGDLLATVKPERGVGPVVGVKVRRPAGQRRPAWDRVPLTDIRPDTVAVDPATSFTVDDGKVPTRCRCGPTRIPGDWIREQLAAGRRTAVWNDDESALDSTAN
jgi:hypothetical protein